MQNLHYLAHSAICATFTQQIGGRKNIGFLSPKCHYHEAPECPIPTHILFCIFMKVRAGHGRLIFGRRQLESKQQYSSY
jgi:hypothetical protein